MAVAGWGALHSVFADLRRDALTCRSPRVPVQVSDHLPNTREDAPDHPDPTSLGRASRQERRE
jgi:hypothetical protein